MSSNDQNKCPINMSVKFIKKMEFIMSRKVIDLFSNK